TLVVVGSVETSAELQIACDTRLAPPPTFWMSAFTFDETTTPETYWLLVTLAFCIVTTLNTLPPVTACPETSPETLRIFVFNVVDCEFRFTWPFRMSLPCGGGGGTVSAA